MNEYDIEAILQATPSIKHLATQRDFDAFKRAVHAAAFEFDTKLVIPSLDVWEAYYAIACP